jgi:hydroxymethylbilane synthase
LEHALTRAAVTAERAVLAELGGGCQVPVGAHAVIEDGFLRLDAVVVASDGSRLIRKRSYGPAAEAARLGAELARALLAAGAREILELVYGDPAE